MNVPPGGVARPHRYCIYGAVLESEIEFPELRPADPDAKPRWRFTLDPDLPLEPEGALLGEDRIYGDVSARLLRDPRGGHWIHVGDTGTFHLSPGAARIRWRPRPDPWWEFGRAHLMGRVLAFAMHLEGVLPLHGSGVAVEEGAVAFLGPKHQGKSTLALALLQRGASLLTDDSLPVEPPLCGRERARVRPGTHGLRLTPESRGLFGLPRTAPDRDGKAVLAELPERRLVTAPLPLAAVYLLNPLPPGRAPTPVDRRRLDGVRAALALGGQQKIGAMLGPGAGPRLLRRAAAVAERVPVYRLDLVRDMERLEAAADRLLRWHRPRNAAPAGEGARRAGARG